MAGRSGAMRATRRSRRRSVSPYNFLRHSGQKNTRRTLQRDGKRSFAPLGRRIGREPHADREWQDRQQKGKHGEIERAGPILGDARDQRPTSAAGNGQTPDGSADAAQVLASVVADPNHRPDCDQQSLTAAEQRGEAVQRHHAATSVEDPQSECEHRDADPQQAVQRQEVREHAAEQLGYQHGQPKGLE